MSEPCPKCGTPKCGSECPKCGLIFAKFDPAAPAEPASDRLRDLWHHTEANWAEPSAHALFIEQALAESKAGFVAACYRAKGNDPTAEAQLKNLTVRLEQTLIAAKTEAPRSTKTFRNAFLILAGFLAAAAALWLLR